MIPLRDSARSRTYPLVNQTLIALNFIVFLYELSLSGRGLAKFIAQYGLVPARLTAWSTHLPEALPYTGLVLAPVISAMFIHANWLHIGGNMLYLWVFGDNVEDRLGHFGYLLFYLGVGAFSFIAQTLANPMSKVPNIGASGAIAGVLGAYFLFYPRARVLAIIPIGIFLQFGEVPAVLFLLIWFGLQVLNVFINAGASAVSQPVAWFAHIGGFLAGVILAWPFRRLRRVRPPRPTS